MLIHYIEYITYVLTFLPVSPHISSQHSDAAGLHSSTTLRYEDSVKTAPWRCE